MAPRYLRLGQSPRAIPAAATYCYASQAAAPTYCYARAALGYPRARPVRARPSCAVRGSPRTCAKGVTAPVLPQGAARPSRPLTALRSSPQMKKVLKPVAWSVPSLVVLIATGVVIGHVVDTFHDATLRWTAIAAVLTAAALLVAVIGLPLALYQLVALDRDLTRPTELRTRVNEYRRSGQGILNRRYEPVTKGPHPDPSDLKRWIDDVATFITEDLGDDAEAEDFRREGLGRTFGEELTRKLEYLRDKLLPKVIAGYW